MSSAATTGPVAKSFSPKTAMPLMLYRLFFLLRDGAGLARRVPSTAATGCPGDS